MAWNCPVIGQCFRPLDTPPLSSMIGLLGAWNRGVHGLDSAVVRGRLACPAIRLRPRRLSTRSGRGKPSAAASLIPNFDFVAIRVGDVGVGVAWAEFAS